MIYRIKTTKPQQFIDITDKVLKEVRQRGVEEGIAVIFVPHTTAGVTINENADPDVLGKLGTVHIISTYSKKLGATPPCLAY